MAFREDTKQAAYDRAGGRCECLRQSCSAHYGGRCGRLLMAGWHARTTSGPRARAAATSSTTARRSASRATKRLSRCGPCERRACRGGRGDAPSAPRRLDARRATRRSGPCWPLRADTTPAASSSAPRNCLRTSQCPGPAVDDVGHGDGHPLVSRAQQEPEETAKEVGKWVGAARQFRWAGKA